MYRQRGRHDRALRPGAAVAAVHDRGQRERPAPAVVADVAVAEVEPGGADLAVVVHRLDHRQAVGVRGAHDPRRDQRVRVVQVQHVRAVLPDERDQVALGVRRPDRRERQQRLLQLADSAPISSELRRNGTHLDAGGAQLRRSRRRRRCSPRTAGPRSTGCARRRLSQVGNVEVNLSACRSCPRWRRSPRTCASVRPATPCRGSRSPRSVP